MKPNDRRLGVLWLVLYILFAIAPLAFMLVGERPMGREFVRELSVAFGFTGIGLMALHFALTARIATIKAPYGSDVVYFFHHKMAYITLFLWLAHPLLLVYQFGWNWDLLNPLTGAWRARWGILSVVAILALMIWALVRRRFQMEYVVWRIWHGALSLVAMSAVMVHAYMVGRYVGTPAKQALWLVYGIIALLLVAYLRVYKPWSMLQRPWRVAEVRPELGQAYSLALEPEGHDGMAFQAGQFAWLAARGSPFAAHEHPFSFSSSSERRDRIEFAIKELGDFTSTISAMPVGKRIYVDGAYGSFSPDRFPDDEQLVLLAGGVGIAPIMSILRTMEDRNDRRPVLLMYGSLNLEWATFDEELTALEQTLNLQLVHVLEQPTADWEGERGYINREMLTRYLPSEDVEYHVYLCGPPAMLTAVSRALEAAGVPMHRILLERFDLA